ncbi:MAG TPA: Hsp20/alpha crystallin family protein [Ktedonobacteraceae bacterium]
MQERPKIQLIPVKMYRTPDRLMVAAPMPGMEPEDILVEITGDGMLILHGALRGVLKDAKEVLIDEWSVGDYHRELGLPDTVDGEHANVTYGNGVLVVAMPISDEMIPGRLTLETVGPAHGEHVGNIGHGLE